MSVNLKIDPYGFREYDARWLYEKDINLLGITNLGKGLGTQITKQTNKTNPKVIVGHDYRSYSEDIKAALKKGLVSTGCYVEDVGLSLSPMVYFAQFHFNSDAVAMVTASHNDNGWTGVKMGIRKGLTHAPEEMKELKEITLSEKRSGLLPFSTALTCGLYSETAFFKACDSILFIFLYYILLLVRKQLYVVCA